MTLIGVFFALEHEFETISVIWEVFWYAFYIFFDFVHLHIYAKIGQNTCPYHASSWIMQAENIMTLIGVFFALEHEYVIVFMIWDNYEKII